MTPAEIRIILTDIIAQNKEHADYKRVTDLAIHYRKLITGKEIGSLLKRFNPRENKDMFDQRVALTIATTPAVTHSAMKPFYKVPGATPLAARVTARREVAAADKAVEEVQDRVKNFYGAIGNIDGLDYFMQTRFMELTFIDPNAWIVIEFDPFDAAKEKAMPRPFEVSSAMAKNFSNRNNQVEWLHVEEKITLMAEDGKKQDGKRHTIYEKDWAVVYTETLLKAAPEGFDLVEIDGKRFLVGEYDHKTGKVPAFRVGYNRDLVTDGRTFVNPLDPAMCHLDKSIKQVSEYDLSTALHTFPQKIIRLVKSCPGVMGDPNGICKGGALIDGSTCPTCAGTGKPIHTSGQDIVEVELPENIKEDGLLPLSEMVYYVPLPIELLKLQREIVDELAIKVHQAVFNTTVLVKKDAQVSGEKTAFEVDNDMESVYDALSPFRDKYSATWMAVVEFIAILTDNADKVSWIHRLPANLKLKSRERLYSEYKIATESAMPSFVIDAITDELAETVFMDDTDALVKYRVKKQHAPFRGKTREEIMFMLSSDEVLAETKILYNYFEEIFQKLEAEYTKTGRDFYLEKPEVRDEKIAALLTEYAAKIQASKPRVMPFSQFQEPDDDNQDDE